MSVAVQVSLEEDSTRSIFQGISGDGEGFQEVRKVEDRTREKELFQLVEGLLAVGGPIPMIVFLGQVQEGVGDSGVVGYEPTVEIGKAKERLYILDFGRCWPGSDAIQLYWVHGKLLWFHNHPEVFDFGDIKLAFLKL